MSMWTHIVAVIDADTFVDSKHIKKEVQKMLKDAPKITGSEGNADVFVNVLSGYNHYISADCEACCFGPTIRYLNDGFSCDAPDTTKCPEGKYQTRVVITVIGDLRDRMREQTKAEWLQFKEFVNKKINGNGFETRNCACRIVGW